METVEKMKAEHFEKFATLVKMHLSFRVDLNTEYVMSRRFIAIENIFVKCLSRLVTCDYSEKVQFSDRTHITIPARTVRLLVGIGIVM